MWDDFGSPMQGNGPTATVLDPDGTPNNILDVLLGGSVQVDWSFQGPGIGFLNAAQFNVELYADPVGAGANTQVGLTVPVAGTLTVAPPGPNPYQATITIPPNFPLGAHRLTALITCTVGGAFVPIAGFVDGPIIQVRPGP